MIAALLGRAALSLAARGVPLWLVKVIGGLVLLAVLYLGAVAGYRHVFNAGVEQEQAAQHVRDAENDRKAKIELAKLNGRVATAQAQLAAARDEVAQLKKEMEDEKANSTDLQRRLLAGEQRLRVLVRAPAPGAAGNAPGAGTVRLDPGAAAEVDLDGTVAANLEWLRSTREQAIQRLDGCVSEYDALKAAVDAIER